jgi:peptide/nickel transport system ATP-binding protein
MTKTPKLAHDDTTHAPRLRVAGLHVSFADRSRRWRRRSSVGPRSRVQAIRGIDISISAGACLGVVGESGCGKSTLARAIMQLVPIDRGSICLDGLDMSALPQDQSRAARQRVQMIFQHAHSSMNPRMTVESIVSDPLRFQKGCGQDERTRRVLESLHVVGFDEGLRNRYPHELSGGQLQRVAIARALVLNPDVLVCDEPVSALDVSAQAEVLAQLKQIQRERSLTMLLITHDQDIAATVCDELAVMYLGRIVEYGPVGDVVGQPKHPYSFFLGAAREALLRDPAADPSNHAPMLGGEPPSPVCPPSGCAFHPRCPIATGLCASQEPELIQVAGESQNRRAACHHSDRMVELKKLTAAG